MCCDQIFINEHNNQYQVNLLIVDKKLTYMIFRKTIEDDGFKTFYVSSKRFDTEKEAYTDAQEVIRNDYKKETE